MPTMADQTHNSNLREKERRRKNKTLKINDV